MKAREIKVGGTPPLVNEASTGSLERARGESDTTTAVRWLGVLLDEAKEGALAVSDASSGIDLDRATSDTAAFRLAWR
jgi:hypothetical protein